MDIKEQICNALITEVKQDNQIRLCKNMGCQMFVPMKKCFNCSKSVWENIDLEQSNKLITGCPNCGRSFCN